MKDFIMRNLRVKILAIFLAFLAWIYVQSSPSVIYFDSGVGLLEQKKELKIEYQNLPENLKLVESTEQIEVTIREGIQSLAPNNPLRAYVDLNQIEEQGRYFLEIQVELTEGMKLLAKRPRYASIFVEEVKK